MRLKTIIILVLSVLFVGCSDSNKEPSMEDIQAMVEKELGKSLVDINQVKLQSERLEVKLGEKKTSFIAVSNDYEEDCFSIDLDCLDSIEGSCDDIYSMITVSLDEFRLQKGELKIIPFEIDATHKGSYIIGVQLKQGENCDDLLYNAQDFYLKVS